MRSFDEVAAEIGTLNSLISMTPEENVIDIASLKSRIRVVLEKAIHHTNDELEKLVELARANGVGL